MHPFHRLFCALCLVALGGLDAWNCRAEGAFLPQDPGNPRGRPGGGSGGFAPPGPPRGPGGQPLPPPSRWRNRSEAPATVGELRLTHEDDRWENWWLFNRERALRLSENFAGRARSNEVSADEFLGRKETLEAAKPALDHRESLRQRLSPILQELLKDSSAIVRAEAALALGKIGGIDEAAALLGALHDRDRSVRELAALGAGLLGQEALGSVLAERLADRNAIDSERVVAALGLGLGRFDGALARLREVAISSHESEVVRAASLLALGEFKDERSQGLLRLIATSPGMRSDLRSTATLALGRMIGFEEVADYVTLLSDPEARVRRSAALGLGRIRFGHDLWAEREAHVQRLRRFEIEGGLDLDGRRELEDLIVRIEHRASALTKAIQVAETLAVARLSDAQRADPDIMTRNLAAVALGRIGSPDARTALLQRFLAENSSQSQRAYLALGIGLAGGMEAAESLRTELSKKALDPSLGAALALGLGFLESDAAGPLLLSLASEGGDPPLRGFASIGLGLMNHQAAKEPLQKLLRDGKVQGLREQFALGLGLMGDTLALDDLRAAVLERTSATERIEAVRALAALRDEASVEILLELLSLRAGAVDELRAVAIHALGQIAEETPLGGLDPLSRDWNWTLPYPLIHAALLR